MRNKILIILLTLLTACNKSSDNADIQAIYQLVNNKVANTEVCLKDKVFHFPDVIVGTKYNGASLAQLNALVIAGLLSESEQIIDPTYKGPKYIYHYKQHSIIEKKTFYLTKLGIKYFRENQKNGYFCYGQPKNIQIESLESTKNKQNELILTAIISYETKINPDVNWITNTWIKKEFPTASWGQIRATIQQQFIKKDNGAILLLSESKNANYYW